MSARSLARKGFTLVELLVVITIILLISSLFLGLNAGDGGGLAAGQRMMGSSIRTLRAMAHNRAACRTSPYLRRWFQKNG